MKTIYYREAYKDWPRNNKFGRYDKKTNTTYFVWKIVDGKHYLFYYNKWQPVVDGTGRLLSWLEYRKEYEESEFEKVSEKEVFMELL